MSDAALQGGWAWNPDPGSIYLTRQEVCRLIGLGSAGLEARILVGEIAGCWMKRTDRNGKHGGQRWMKVYRLAEVLRLTPRYGKSRQRPTRLTRNGNGARAAETSGERAD